MARRDTSVPSRHPSPLRWATVAAVLTGCLLPPPVEQLSAPENRPPRILAQNLAPGPTREPLELPEACPEIDAVFDASILDPDGDTLYWRVFVDYWATDTDRSPPIHTENPNAANALPITFPLERSDFTLRSAAVHTVELFVADRPFAEGRLDQEGRILTDGEGLTDIFIWPVVLDPNRNVLCPGF